MEKSKISFVINNIYSDEKKLQVELNILNLSNKQDIKLYKGNTKLTNIICEESYQIEGEYLHIQNITNNKLQIKYEAKIGNLGKHGQNGELNKNLITFSGDQVLMLPMQVLSCNNDKLRKLVDEISIKYHGFDLEKVIIPYECIIDNNFVSICKQPKWDNIYELMKSCYAFGNFYNIQKETKKNSIQILINYYLSNEYKNEVINGINCICDYYEKLFDYKIDKLRILLLDKNNKDNKDNEYILGGVGRNIMGATFNNNLRDWQLLSHRLFHAYMDSSINIRNMRIAPHIWITEGLATYYENIALENVDNSIKERLNIDSNNEFKKIFKRYLYMKLKYSNRFSLIPMEESSIKSQGKIEFLHYTQAPLIIKLMEDTSNKSGEKNSCIKYLRNASDLKFHIKDMFDYILNTNCDIFAMKFLFSSEIIPLWYLGKDNNSVEESIKELNDYECLLGSWFITEDESYIIQKIDNCNLDNLLKLENINNVQFNNPFIEDKVKEFSMTIYKLLKLHFLKNGRF